jgi:serine/threonine protein kinase
MSENSDWAFAGFVPGTRMSHYLLEQQIGAGGMAVVFRARDENLDRTVALKILTPALAADQGFRQRFIRESRAAAAVDDPHIVPVYEASEADGVLFIAMRYVRGGSVADLLHQQGALTPGQLTDIVSPIAAALDAAHRAGLVHRDVKPGNMLVDTHPDRPDHVYLSDFGLTKGAQASAGLTGTNQILGTPSYMAPEQIEGREVTGRSDQYSLACAAFEMLTGRAPFCRDQGIAVLWAHLNEAVPPLSSLRPELPARADPAFAKALAKAHQNRFATCRDFADALREAFDISSYHSGSRSAPRSVPSPTPWPGQYPAASSDGQAAPVSSERTHDARGPAPAHPSAGARPPGIQALPATPANYQPPPPFAAYQPTPYPPPGYPPRGYPPPGYPMPGYPPRAPVPRRPPRYPPVVQRRWSLLAYLLPIVIPAYGIVIVPFLLFIRDRSVRMSIVTGLEIYLIFALGVVFGGIAGANKRSPVLPIFAVFSVLSICLSLILLVIAFVQLCGHKQPNIPLFSKIAYRVTYGRRNTM